MKKLNRDQRKGTSKRKVGTKRPAGRKTATRRKVANPSGLVVRAGDRVEMHPASPRWKAGDKFCVVTGISDAGIDVEFDLSGDIRRIQPMSIGRVNGAVVDGVVYPTPKGKRRKVTNPSRDKFVCTIRGLTERLSSCGSSDDHNILREWLTPKTSHEPSLAMSN